jgi:hypothetical protein
VGFLQKLLFGDGSIEPGLRTALEAEGVVLVEEGLRASIRYSRFRAPGRRHNGKVTIERVGLGISEQRFVVYCRSGERKLVDTGFSNERLGMVEVSLSSDGAVAIKIDYDRQTDSPKVSGQITITARTPNAPRIVDELRRRLVASRQN